MDLAGFPFCLAGFRLRTLVQALWKLFRFHVAVGPHPNLAMVSFRQRFRVRAGKQFLQKIFVAVVVLCRHQLHAIATVEAQPQVRVRVHQHGKLSMGPLTGLQNLLVLRGKVVHTGRVTMPEAQHFQRLLIQAPAEFRNPAHFLRLPRKHRRGFRKGQCYGFHHIPDTIMDAP